MNICYVSSEPMPPEEGIGFYVWNLSHYLARQGHTIHIITRGGMERFSKDVIDKITVWRPRFLPVYPFHVHFHRFFVDKVVRTIENDIDLFHVHSPLVPVLSTKRPVMLTFHSAIRSDAQQTPVRDIDSLLLKLQAPVSVQLEKRQLSRANSVNVVAPHVVENLRSYSTCPSEVDVTWNGVDVDLFHHQRYRTAVNGSSENGSSVNGQPSHYSAQGLSVLAVGRLVPGKGWEDFLEAIAIVHQQNPTTIFRIAGDGPLRAKLEKQIARNQLGHVVQMLGHVGGTDQGERTALAKLYAEADLFVMPSHYEGLPTVVLEAMASSCPVLSTRVGGVPNIIDDGQSGMLVDPGVPESLAKAMDELIANASLREQLGREARRVAESRFSWQAIGDRYLQQYQALTVEGSLA